jgi:hypothetical protein
MQPAPSLSLLADSLLAAPHDQLGTGGAAAGGGEAPSPRKKRSGRAARGAVTCQVRCMAAAVLAAKWAGGRGVGGGPGWQGQRSAVNPAAIPPNEAMVPPTCRCLAVRRRSPGGSTTSGKWVGDTCAEAHCRACCCGMPLPLAWDGMGSNQGAGVHALPSSAADLPRMRPPWLLCLMPGLAAATRSAISTARCSLWRSMAAPSASASRCAAVWLHCGCCPPACLPAPESRLPAAPSLHFMNINRHAFSLPHAAAWPLPSASRVR